MTVFVYEFEFELLLSFSFPAIVEHVIFRVRDRGAYIVAVWCASWQSAGSNGGKRREWPRVFEVRVVDVHNGHGIAAIGCKRVVSHREPRGTQRASLEAANPKSKPWRRAGRAPRAAPATSC
jgi:hypothetical protein